MTRLAIAMLIGAMLAPYDAAADSFRCGGKIVRAGMTMDDVRKACGSPTSTDVEEHDVRAGNRVVGTTQIHTWRYRRSSGQRTAVLVFDEGVVRSISMESK